MSSSMLRRSGAERVFFGVCGGIANAVRVDVILVRIVFVLTAVLGGAGIVAYVAAGLFLGNPAQDDPRRRWAKRVGEVLGLSILLSVSSETLWAKMFIPLDMIVPITFLAAGLALAWKKVGAGTLENDRVSNLQQSRAAEAMRIAAGFVLTAGGAYSFLGSASASQVGYVTDIDATRAAVVAAAVVAAGLGVLIAPRLHSARAEADTERRDRIRSEERERVAARLHDSVLQTLALIQRTDDSKRTQQLSRRQERELRAWLYGDENPEAPETFAAALRHAAEEVEERYQITVDLVQPTDSPMDPTLEALIAAAREAMTNAAKHADIDQISVFARITEHAASVFIRDRGCGFDHSAIPPDRRGVREYIEARMSKHSGTAKIQTAPGQGTEIELMLPRKVLSTL